MNNRRGKLALVLVTLMLLLVLALGSLAPGAFAREVGPQAGVAALVGPPGLVAPCGYDGGGSGA